MAVISMVMADAFAAAVSKQATDPVSNGLFMVMHSLEKFVKYK